MIAELYHFQSGLGAPAENMAWDEALLERVADLGAPILRFYGWQESAATFGYFQKFAEVQGMTWLRPLIRRLTGGGLVPHEADWTYSLAVPPVHPWYHLRAQESYERLHQWMQESFHRMGLAVELAGRSAKSFPGRCFAGPERFDVVWAGQKIAGAAQRRTRIGLLIQGSIQPPSGWNRRDWERSVLESAPQAWGSHVRSWDPPPCCHQRALELARTKYGRPEYNQQR